jgi:hypothetical protein
VTYPKVLKIIHLNMHRIFIGRHITVAGNSTRIPINDVEILHEKKPLIKLPGVL